MALNKASAQSGASKGWFSPVVRYYLLLALTWALAGAEVLLFGRYRNYWGPEVSPLIFYLTSIALSVAGLGCALYLPTAGVRLRPKLSHATIWGLVVALVGLVVLVIQQGPVLAAMPDPSVESDVIPILRHYVLRFRSGEVVYKYILFGPPFSYPLFPNHLPMQWLPYVLADQAKVDYRWWALLSLLLVGFGAYLMTAVVRRISWPSLLLLAPLPAWLLYEILTQQPTLYHSVAEPTIIAYYCILAAAVLSRSPWLQAAALVMCLLSRYSVVLWVPLYGVILWREEGWRHAWLVAGLTLTGIIGIYVGPFLSHDWTIFTHALREYRIATLGEWQRGYHLYKGMGFAGWFAQHATGDLAQKIALFQRLNLLASGIVVALWGGLWWWFRNRISYRILALLALKAYLATFYAFLQIPYAYLTSLMLFLTPFVLLALTTMPREATQVVPATLIQPDE